MSKREINLLIKRLVSLESEAFYRKTEELGQKANPLLPKSQMEKLQNVAYSCDKVVDIFDYLKNQTGKDLKKESWAKDGLGQLFLETLTDLNKSRERLIRKIEEQELILDEFDRQKIYLELCREFIRHTVAQYLYGEEVQV